jgi:hypothetical protein
MSGMASSKTQSHNNYAELSNNDVFLYIAGDASCPSSAWVGVGFITREARELPAILKKSWERRPLSSEANAS